ncbi:hypothetical protein LCGC14_0460380 [marine sediment metagenome]|uniref:Uncharacterized protein n=1 Tax=marine sediment metagenome TaxID=412755 RepID=A0A0F9VP57_9ZZZZ
MDTGNGTSVQEENTAMAAPKEMQNEDPGPPTHIVSAIRALIGKEVKLETKDGSARHGTLTDVPMESIIIGDDTAFVWPRGVILNGDKTDEIAWSQLAWIRLA